MFLQPAGGPQTNSFWAPILATQDEVQTVGKLNEISFQIQKQINGYFTEEQTSYLHIAVISIT